MQLLSAVGRSVVPPQLPWLMLGSTLLWWKQLTGLDGRLIAERLHCRGTAA